MKFTGPYVLNRCEYSLLCERALERTHQSVLKVNWKQASNCIFLLISFTEDKQELKLSHICLFTLFVVSSDSYKAFSVCAMQYNASMYFSSFLSQAFLQFNAIQEHIFIHVTERLVSIPKVKKKKKI